MNITQIHPPAELDRCLAVFRELVVKDSGDMTDTWILRKDGRLTPVDISGRLIKYGGKTVVQGIFIDISERQKMEAERLKISNLESLGTLAGGLAHEFNNILAAIMGNLDLAMLDTKMEEETKESLAGMDRSCQRAAALARRLLTFAKGGAPLKEITSMPELLRDTADFTLSGSRSGCEFSISPDLWPARVDAGQISQAIGNILLNADQTMPEGGMIKIEAANVIQDEKTHLPLPPGKYLQIAMTDQGGGIDPKIIHKLFDPYFSTKQVGSGLGLTTAYAIIKNHGGYLTVASEAGVGATFIIYLPALETGEPEPQAAVLPEKGQGRILVMDDEAPVRQMLGKMLTKLGYDAVFATNGREALEIYRQAGDAGQPFAAAILDLTIPGGMGGKDAIKQLQKLDPHVKAIVSSGYADDPIMAAFAKYGFRGVIAKPYKIEDLSRVLAEIIQKTPDSEKSG